MTINVLKQVEEYYSSAFGPNRISKHLLDMAAGGAQIFLCRFCTVKGSHNFVIIFFKGEKKDSHFLDVVFNNSSGHHQRS